MIDLDALAREIAESDEITVNWGPGQGESVIQGRLAELIAAALLRARNEAIEEAAKVADGLDYHSPGHPSVARNIANAIMALKTKGE